MKNALHGATVLAASFAIALVTALGVSGPHGFSSQGNVYLPTTGTYSSLQAVGYMNDAWDALLTCNKGPAAPVNAIGGTPKAGQCWLDDSNATLLVKKRYSGSGWVVEGVIDVSNGVWSPPVGGGAASVTAAATTDLCAAPAAFQTVSGTSTIGSFGATCASGVKKTLVFSGAATLTYHATSLILPGQVDYLTSAGDVVEAVALGAGNWRVTAITKINGNAVTNPAVEVGVALNFFGGAVPPKYVLGYGQALPRADYPQYVAAVTVVQSATRSSGNNTLTSVADTSRIGVGMPIEGNGIQNGTTVVSVTSGTIIMSANAASSGSSNVTVFLTGYGAGGSTSTVGVPDCRDRVIAGRGDMGGTAPNRLTSSYFGADTKAMAATGGSENVTMAAGNLIQHDHAVYLNDPGHTHSYNGGDLKVSAAVNQDSFSSFPSGRTTGASTTGITVWSGSGGTGNQNKVAATGSATPTPMRTVQPTLIADCMIRVLAMQIPDRVPAPVYQSRPLIVFDRRMAA